MDEKGAKSNNSLHCRALPRRGRRSMTTAKNSPKHHRINACAASVGSRRRQSQKLLHDIVNDELTRNNEADVNDPRPGPPEKLRGTPPAVNIPDHAEEALRSDVALVRFGQYHIPRLAEHAREQGRDERRQDRDDPFQIVGRRRFGRQGRVQHPGDHVERDLLGHGVRNLLGQHGPQPAEEGGDSAVVPDQLGQCRQQSVVGIIFVGDDAYAGRFHGAQQYRRDGARHDARGDEGRGGGIPLGGDEAGEERFEYRLEYLVDSEFHGPLDAVSDDGRAESAEEGGGAVGFEYVD
mmetsp:Transcript_27882/g.81874  ORF Transcript_27882/g.81874 Transcript_27882/m.81874 type:complete len:293 (-) Transcript_27882:695-1573(-)